MSEISKLTARGCVDRRGRPVWEIGVSLSSGVRSGVVVPRTGGGTGGEFVVFPQLCGAEISDQRRIDELLILIGAGSCNAPGTEVLRGVSLAAAVAAAQEADMPLFRYLGGVRANALPVPVFDLLRGGATGETPLAFRSLAVIPRGFDRFSAACAAVREIVRALRSRLRRGPGTAAGSVFRWAFAAVEAAARDAGFPLGGAMMLAVDCSAGSFHQDGIYDYRRWGDRGVQLDRAGQIGWLEALARDYPISYFEDPLAENDFSGFAELTERFRDRVIVAGGELYAGDPERIRRGAAAGSTSAAILDPGRIGTLSETLDAAAAAQTAGLRVGLELREPGSAALLADLAVALNAGLIRCGAPGSGRDDTGCARLVALENFGK